MNTPAPTRDEVLRHYDKKGDKSVECKYCHQTRLFHATRCKDHLIECKLAPVEVKEKFAADVENRKQKHKRQKLNEASYLMLQLAGNGSNGEAEDPGLPAVNSSPSIPSGSGKQIQLTLPFPVMSQKKKKELQVDWAKAIVSGSIPHNFVKNFYLQKFRSREAYQCYDRVRRIRC